MPYPFDIGRPTPEDTAAAGVSGETHLPLSCRMRRNKFALNEFGAVEKRLCVFRLVPGNKSAFAYFWRLGQK